MSISNEPMERLLLTKLVDLLLKKLDDPEAVKEMTASEMELIRKLTQDAGITIADIDQHSFGSIGQEAVKKAKELVKREQQESNSSNGLPFKV